MAGASAHGRYLSDGRLYRLSQQGDRPFHIIGLLNKELNAGLGDPKIKGRIEELGGTVLGGTPAEFATILAAAVEK
jgi:hypothetical protein